MKPDPKMKSIYRASFNAKIAKTISLAHLGGRAIAIYRDSLPRAFHTDQSLAVSSFLQKCSTAETVPCDPSMSVLISAWSERAETKGVDIEGCETPEQIAEVLGIARLKILSTAGAMDAAKEEHFQRWLKALYQDLFPVKSRAKTLSKKLYQVKHDFLSKHSPACYHQLPSGDIRPYYEIRGWEFHGDKCELPAGEKAKQIDDFQHLDLKPIEEAYTKDPWDDVIEQVKWDRGSALGERFFMAAHDDFHDWLQSQREIS
jgi:hypothetical protein